MRSGIFVAFIVLTSTPAPADPAENMRAALVETQRLAQAASRHANPNALTVRPQRPATTWPVWKGSVVGGLLGAGLAAGYGAWYCSPGNACDGEQLRGALFFAPFGAGIGAATGAVIAWVADR